ncbi:hypothetical protein [Cytobacillus purgationiresistens]|uniref:GH25 family protein n=1 Tax=Cytobacillus purgationiresistens TaxID=863449 RepID=A0ABU0ADF2_9BACI|nr:hypothetical protein [Cytobacillus purgationiresistens]MDQ0269277.1 putative GH25 family protein [Cytobacillus purgationiresistens]
MKKLSVSILLLALMAGCSSSHEAEHADRDYNLNDANSVKLSSPAGHRPDATKEFAMYEQNPNLLNTNGDKVSERSDIDKARIVINTETDYKPGAVWIDGEHLRVTAYAKKDFKTDNEREKAEEKLHKILQGALPTYYIDVKLREDHND